MLVNDKIGTKTVQLRFTNATEVIFVITCSKRNWECTVPKLKKNFGMNLDPLIHS
jgi:hypothetical protein